jgi:alanine racemase
MLNIKINLGTIIGNIQKIKNAAASKTKICAVVKADAYSLGAALISRITEEKVDMFAVATSGEGGSLRNVNIKKDILLFGVCDDIKNAIKNNLIITISSVKEIKAILAANKYAAVHIAVNTGMNRYGVRNFSQFVKIINVLQKSRNIAVGGLYTHFGYEDNRLKEVNEQLQKFQPYVDYFKEYYPDAIIHCACSGTAMQTAAQMDMVRIGKAMYGGYDGYDMALTVSSKIAAIQKIKAGDKVGYNGEFTAENNMTVGIVTGGYADGINTKFSGHNFITVDNIPCRILGRICMDCFFIDVSQIKNPLNKTVVIMSPEPRQTLCEISGQTGIIVCDILCGIKKHRVKIHAA